ncbi:HNH endonuclease [Metabacillus elymi]|uniref:HNH endonuclease n=1 Tax=Metabacillus elymi TaxID=2745198 RepID=A0ABX6S6D7_9BACI|nr:HNH endonuclease [Metabacillus sp. KUDC1714]QNF29650.1 HNH endonuclease [Metabacillus sp. KUDC1714]
MAFFRAIGKGIGTIGGGIIGGGVKVVGKTVGSKWVEEVGDGIKQASTIALDNAGQFVDGAVKGTYGLIKQDDLAKQEGFGDLKDSTGRTLKGLGNTIEYTVKSAGTTYQGLKSGDSEQALQGVKNIGKVAVVSTLAIGVVDFVDGADVVDAEELDTRNDHLSGDVHPETGVPFETKTVELPNGEIKTSAFPVFETAYEITLPENMYLQSDSVHFSYANNELYEEIQTNPSLANELDLDKTDIEQLSQGNTPEGYTWHHNESPGILQLVNEETHHNTGHTGGRELWAGGVEYR